MKKTIHTLLTAAMFAASNAMAMPAVAEDGNAGRPVVDPVETIRLEDPNWNSGQQENDPQVTTTTKLIEATKTTTVTLYGVCPSTTTIRDINQLTTTVVEPVYGTKPTTSLTATTTSIPDDVITLTTTTVQPVYGPPLQDFVGDVNFDGYVDSFDILAVRKMLVKGTERYSDQFMEAYYADMNNDGKLSISDLILLQQYVLGKVTKQELQQRFNYWYGSHNIEIEQITTAPENTTTTGTSTTTTTTYEPIKDTVVTLYGIMPSRDAKAQMINPNQTTETTAQQITPEEK
ncbi:dockerin type I repeat-containing protein [Ruminococcus flavefaciens]|uniref:dockerin type I repeat-containing protein n=1 Tax=Ruminococcus flavefaciens TaxID=1265 RepID=UPI0026ED6658|nr:dockerin type I repeat-containing protein [Ruminococcus flavefaciens]